MIDNIEWGEVEPNFEGVMPCDGDRRVRVTLEDSTKSIAPADCFDWSLDSGFTVISSYQLEALPLPVVTKEEKEAFRKIEKRQKDNVNHPGHYTAHPSGIECIQITEHMGFNLGNAMKYIWRCDLKKDAVVDLLKAKFYIEREIAKRANL